MPFPDLLRQSICSRLAGYEDVNDAERLALPRRIEKYSLTSLQQRLVKTGGRLVKHARSYCLLLAESRLTRRLFASMARRIGALAVETGVGCAREANRAKEKSGRIGVLGTA